ncbi:MAG: hypothetical protein PHQ65_16730 [Bacteroidales bacterium]|nr:hypothetical protein [Bacteroidales bacterium]
MNKSKLLITQQEMVLIKNSDETKNVDIYGNLFDCLTDYKKLSAQDLEKDITFDDRARAVLMSVDNKKVMMDKIISEWYASREFETTDREIFCQLCNTRNKYIFYIRNKITEIELNVGSECVRKFPDITGIKQQNKKLSQLIKENEKQKRTIEFDSFLKDDIGFLKESEQNFSNYPVMLTKKLHRDIEETIRQMNTLRTSYIGSGGNIQDIIAKYIRLKEDIVQLFSLAENRRKQVSSSILACDRDTSDWLKKNNPTVWNDVLENDGLFNKSTLMRMYYPKYIEKQLQILRKRISDSDITLQKLSGDSLSFLIRNKRYHSGVTFLVKIKWFMKEIGCYCLTEQNYSYGKKDLKEVAIEPSKHNFDAISNSIYAVMTKQGYDIREEKSGDIYWVQKEHKKKASMWSSEERVTQGVLYKRLRDGDLTTVYSQFLLLEESVFIAYFDEFKRKMEAGKTWISESDKKQNEEIAREAHGLQRQREFIHY